MIDTPEQAAARKVFQLSHTKPGVPMNIRFYFKTRTGYGRREGAIVVGFGTPFYLDKLTHWNRETNRLADHAPDAKRINEKLTELQRTSLEAIAAGMTQEEVRELVGVPPTRVRKKPESPRRKKSEISVADAKKTLVQKGWKHIKPIPALAPAPDPDEHDSETQEILDKYQQYRPVEALTLPSELPASSPALIAPVEEPAVSEQPEPIPLREYWTVVDEQGDQHGGRMAEKEAGTRAIALAKDSGQVYFVQHCKLARRVRILIDVEEL